MVRLFIAGACAAVSSAQVGDLIATRGLVIKGEVQANVRLLTEGELSIDPAARIRGNITVPEQPVPPETPIAERGQPSTAVRITNPVSDPTLKGQLVGVPGFPVGTVSVLPAATGTEPRTIDGSDALPTDFSKIKDLTVRYTFAGIPVPAGTYGNLVVEGARLILGESGGRVPVRYAFETLELRNNGRIDLAGPVIITVGRVVGIDGLIGRADLPGWLDLRIISGAVALSNRSVVHGSVSASNSAVTFAGGAKVEGWLIGDTVTLEPQSRFRAIRPIWDERRRHPSQAPSFPQKAFVLQARLPSFAAAHAGSFASVISYANDIPTLTLTGTSTSSKAPAVEEEQRAFFNAACLLLAFTDVDAARIVIVRTAGSAPAVDLTMTKADFASYFWSLGQPEATALEMDAIRNDPARLAAFVERSLNLAAARQQTN